MPQPFDIVIRNFYRMLRSGAMNENVDLEPMSAYKWRRLAEMAVEENVADVTARAVKNHQYETSFNMPTDTRNFLLSSAATQRVPNIRLEMSNPSLNKKLSTIMKDYKRSDCFSEETLEVFTSVVANCQHLLNKGISTRHLIRLGNYIRNHTKAIDFTRVNSWLRDLQLHRVASLVGSVLISNFAFSKEELPFVSKVDDKAAKTMTQHLRQLKIGEANMSAEHRGAPLAYFGYAPLENTSIILRSLKTRLDSIDE